MDKRATIDDKVLIFLGFTMAIFFVLCMGLIYTQLWDVLYTFESNSSKQMLDLMQPAQVISWFDIMLLCGYFAANIIACIVLPMFLPNNPAYFVIIFFFGFLWIFCVALWSNVISEVIADMGGLALTPFVVANSVWFESVFLMILALVMYYKRPSGVLA